MYTHTQGSSESYGRGATHHCSGAHGQEDRAVSVAPQGQSRQPSLHRRPRSGQPQTIPAGQHDRAERPGVQKGHHRCHGCHAQRVSNLLLSATCCWLLEHQITPFLVCITSFFLSFLRRCFTPFLSDTFFLFFQEFVVRHQAQLSAGSGQRPHLHI